MGRKRLSREQDAPLPEGLYLHGLQYRARLPGQRWTYFGRDRLAAIEQFAKWLLHSPAVHVDAERVVAMARKAKTTQRERKIAEAKAIVDRPTIDPK